jgi:hypothetical protein
VHPPRRPQDALRPDGAARKLRELLGGAAYIEELLGR